MNRFKNKANLQNYQKANLFLHLMYNLRNRAFYFENLYNLNDDNKPRLSTKIYKPKITINLAPAKIKVFLKDLIDELSK